METLLANPKKFPPKVIAKARKALCEGFRRPVNATNGKWCQISVCYRYRLLLRGDGVAELLSHESINAYMGRRGHNA